MMKSTLVALALVAVLAWATLAVASPQGEADALRLAELTREMESTATTAEFDHSPEELALFELAASSAIEPEMCRMLPAYAKTGDWAARWKWNPSVRAIAEQCRGQAATTESEPQAAAQVPVARRRAAKKPKLSAAQKRERRARRRAARKAAEAARKARHQAYRAAKAACQDHACVLKLKAERATARQERAAAEIAQCQSNRCIRRVERRQARAQRRVRALRAMKKACGKDQDCRKKARAIVREATRRHRRARRERRQRAERRADFREAKRDCSGSHACVQQLVHQRQVARKARIAKKLRQCRTAACAEKVRRQAKQASKRRQALEAQLAACASSSDENNKKACRAAVKKTAKKAARQRRARQARNTRRATYKQQKRVCRRDRECVDTLRQIRTEAREARVQRRLSRCETDECRARVQKKAAQHAARLKAYRKAKHACDGQRSCKRAAKAIYRKILRLNRARRERIVRRKAFKAARKACQQSSQEPTAVQFCITKLRHARTAERKVRLAKQIARCANSQCVARVEKSAARNSAARKAYRQELKECGADAPCRSEVRQQFRASQAKKALAKEAQLEKAYALLAERTSKSAKQSRRGSATRCPKSGSKGASRCRTLKSRVRQCRASVRAMKKRARQLHRERAKRQAKARRLRRARRAAFGQAMTQCAADQACQLALKEKAKAARKARQAKRLAQCADNERCIQRANERAARAKKARKALRAAVKACPAGDEKCRRAARKAARRANKAMKKLRRALRRQMRKCARKADPEEKQACQTAAKEAFKKAQEHLKKARDAYRAKKAACADDRECKKAVKKAYRKAKRAQARKRSGKKQGGKIGRTSRKCRKLAKKLRQFVRSLAESSAEDGQQQQQSQPQQQEQEQADQLTAHVKKLDQQHQDLKQHRETLADSNKQAKAATQRRSASSSESTPESSTPAADAPKDNTAELVAKRQALEAQWAKQDAQRAAARARRIREEDAQDQAREKKRQQRHLRQIKKAAKSKSAKSTNSAAAAKAVAASNKRGSGETRDWDAKIPRPPTYTPKAKGWVAPYGKLGANGCPGCKKLGLRRKWDIVLDPTSVSEIDLPLIQELHRRIDWMLPADTVKHMNLREQGLRDARQQVVDAEEHHGRVYDFEDRQRKDLLIPQEIQDEQKIVQLE